MKKFQFTNANQFVLLICFIIIVFGILYNTQLTHQIFIVNNPSEVQLIRFHLLIRWALIINTIAVSSILLGTLYLKKIRNAEQESTGVNRIVNPKFPDRLWSNMSHEIRSPLTCIMGFTEIIDQLETDPEKKKYIQAIKTSSDHLLNTVNDILDFSKLEAGKMKLDLNPFKLSETLYDIANAFNVLAFEKKIQIKVEIGFSKDLVVIGDQFRLKQILYNLMSNAIKFTNKGFVVITADTKMKADNLVDIRIQVADTGIGISEKNLANLFEEFRQVHTPNNELKRAIKGTGLGLSICKMLVEMQDGKIQVNSKENEGTVFSIFLTYSIEQRRTTDQFLSNYATTTSSQNANYFGKKALIIEDNDMNALFLSSLLQKQKLSYDIAKNGSIGWKLFNENNYDIILTDINVPEMRGDQLATAIRKSSHEKSNMPVIALTATHQKMEIETYLKSGISDILLKPFKEAELSNILQKHMLTQA